MRVRDGFEYRGMSYGKARLIANIKRGFYDCIEGSAAGKELKTRNTFRMVLQFEGSFASVM